MPFLRARTSPGTWGGMAIGDAKHITVVERDGFRSPQGRLAAPPTELVPGMEVVAEPPSTQVAPQQPSAPMRSTSGHLAIIAAHLALLLRFRLGRPSLRTISPPLLGRLRHNRRPRRPLGLKFDSLSARIAALENGTSKPVDDIARPFLGRRNGPRSGGMALAQR